MQEKDRPFPRYAHDYFDQLRQQYILLVQRSADPIPPSIVALMTNAQEHPQETSWADVFALETAYLYAIPKERVSDELLLARDRYRDIIGADEYAAYAKSVPNSVSLSVRTEPELRSELMTLAERIRYQYTFVPPKESVRNKISMRTGWWTLAAALLGIAVYVITRVGLNSAVVTILVVMFVGQMGGFLSVQQRLQAAAGVDPLFKELQLTNGWFSVVVIAPISGAIFAIVLYFLFVGGLMTGGLFPRFGPSPAPSPPPPAASTPTPTPTTKPTPAPTTKPTQKTTPRPTSTPRRGTQSPPRPGATRTPPRPQAAPAPCTACTPIPAPTPTPCPNDAYCSPLDITQFLERARPTALEDWGKLLVWAFIAGFAERFVPDALTRLTGQATSSGTPTKVVTTTPLENRRKEDDPTSPETRRQDAGEGPPPGPNPPPPAPPGPKV